MQLKVRGGDFTGYDYYTGSHLSEHVSGRPVTIYDCGEGSDLGYTV